MDLSLGAATAAAERPSANVDATETVPTPTRKELAAWMAAKTPWKRTGSPLAVMPAACLTYDRPLPCGPYLPLRWAKRHVRLQRKGQADDRQLGYFAQTRGSNARVPDGGGGGDIGSPWPPLVRAAVGTQHAFEPDELAACVRIAGRRTAANRAARSRRVGNDAGERRSRDDRQCPHEEEEEEEEEGVCPEVPDINGNATAWLTPDVQGVLGEHAFCRMFQLPVELFDVRCRRADAEDRFDAVFPNGWRVDVKCSLRVDAELRVPAHKLRNPPHLYALVTLAIESRAGADPGVPDGASRTTSKSDGMPSPQAQTNRRRLTAAGAMGDDGDGAGEDVPVSMGAEWMSEHAVPFELQDRARRQRWANVATQTDPSIAHFGGGVTLSRARDAPGIARTQSNCAVIASFHGMVPAACLVRIGDRRPLRALAHGSRGTVPVVQYVVGRKHLADYDRAGTALARLNVRRHGPPRRRCRALSYRAHACFPRAPLAWVPTE